MYKAEITSSDCLDIDMECLDIDMEYVGNICIPDTCCSLIDQ